MLTEPVMVEELFFEYVFFRVGVLPEKSQMASSKPASMKMDLSANCSDVRPFPPVDVV